MYQLERTRNQFQNNEAIILQGCILNPIFLNTNVEWIIKERLKECIFSSHLRYTDHTTLLAATIKELLELLEKLEIVQMAARLRIIEQR